MDERESTSLGLVDLVSLDIVAVPLDAAQHPKLPPPDESLLLFYLAGSLT